MKGFFVSIGFRCAHRHPASPLYVLKKDHTYPGSSRRYRTKLRWGMRRHSHDHRANDVDVRVVIAVGQRPRYLLAGVKPLFHLIGGCKTRLTGYGSMASPGLESISSLKPTSFVGFVETFGPSSNTGRPLPQPAWLSAGERFCKLQEKDESCSIQGLFFQDYGWLQC